MVMSLKSREREKVNLSPLSPSLSLSSAMPLLPKQIQCMPGSFQWATLYNFLGHSFSYILWHPILPSLTAIPHNNLLNFTLLYVPTNLHLAFMHLFVAFQTHHADAHQPLCTFLQPLSTLHHLPFTSPVSLLL
eukprot:Phypoly_transcript_16252.p1 GENE.Phypoly_transcript_16252~~Phypoly_transcript_16252.p1  ORF type:complete len:133 (+),score=17.39 Phypoly_transcript_16252:48-446(+)